MFYKQQECSGQLQDACSELPILTISENQLLQRPELRTEKKYLETSRVRVGSIVGFPIYLDQPCGPCVNGKSYWTPVVLIIRRDEFKVVLGAKFTLKVQSNTVAYVCMATSYEVCDNGNGLIVTAEVDGYAESL